MHVQNRHQALQMIMRFNVPRQAAMRVMRKPSNLRRFEPSNLNSELVIAQVACMRTCAEIDKFLYTCLANKRHII
jgi:hypothetical protein